MHRSQRPAVTLFARFKEPLIGGGLSVKECPTPELGMPEHFQYDLLLGAGFSHGLVPTAQELVTDSLPSGCMR